MSKTTTPSPALQETNIDTLRPSWAKGRADVSGRDATWYGPTVRAGGATLRLMQMAEQREDGWHLDRAPRIVIDGDVLTIAAATKRRDVLDTLISQAKGDTFEH